MLVAAFFCGYALALVSMVGLAIGWGGDVER